MKNSQRAILVFVCLVCFATAASEAGAQTAGKSAPPTQANSAEKTAPAKAAATMKPPATGKATASNEAFTIEQVLSFSFPEPDSLISAPNGDRVAWVSNTLGRRNIWGAEAPQWTGHQITHYTADDGQEITQLEFSGNGALIVFVRGGEQNREGELPDPDSDPNGVEQAVFTVSWSGGAPHKVDVGHAPHISPHSTASTGWIAFEKEGKSWIASLPAGKPAEIYTRGENGEIEWSPDGKRLAFVSNRASHSLIAVYDAPKKSVSWVSPTVDRDTTPRWSPDGKYIAFVRIPAAGGFGAAARGGRGGGVGRGGRGGGAGTSIWVDDVAKDEAHHAFTVAGGIGGNLAVQHDVLNWGADDRLVFASEADGWNHLYSESISGGDAALLTPGECEFEYMSLSADRKNVLFNSNCGDIDRRHLWQVSVSGGAPVAITSGDSIQWFPVATSSGKFIAYFASDAQHPATPFVRAWDSKQPAAAKPQAMMALPKDFPTDKLVTPKQEIFQTLDGFTIHGQLFMPADMRRGEKRPAIIFFHGGPVREMLLGWHYMYYYSNSYGMNQYLASHGYIVLSVNYRGGIGYGRAFRMAPDRGAQGGSEYQDVLAAANFLRSRDDVDISRIGLWGGSYGGYLTALGLARNSDLFAAGVDLHGVHDWSQEVAHARLPNGVTAQPQMNPEAARLARESSPAGSVSTWRSPVLLIQGDDDRNVYFGQMIEMATLLRQQGVQFEQLVFPDEVHDFLMWHDWVHAYHAGLDFFDRKLKASAGGMSSAGGQ
jgi:dipeptidyl aminopeptidase/acylaminoacyl peptidase